MPTAKVHGRLNAGQCNKVITLDRKEKMRMGGMNEGRKGEKEEKEKKKKEKKKKKRNRRRKK